MVSRPQVHRWTWYSNAGGVQKEIDHVLVLLMDAGQICSMDFASIELCTTPSSCLCLFVCLCAGYLKKLWTDSDETWWTGWVFDHDELIRFW